MTGASDWKGGTPGAGACPTPSTVRATRAGRLGSASLSGQRAGRTRHAQYIDAGGWSDPDPDPNSVA